METEGSDVFCSGDACVAVGAKQHCSRNETDAAHQPRRRRRLYAALPLFLMLGLLAAAPSTQPSGETALAIRATDAFNSGDYATALPLLVTLQKQYIGTDKSGPIAEEINVCKTQLAGSPATQPSNGPDIPMSAETRKKHVPPKPGEVLEMEIKELGNFDYDADKGGNIPPDVIALSGSKIRLKGFMIPMDQADKITQFAMVPSLFACCYGQPPQVQHTIVCQTPKGKAVSYYPDEIQVEGTLTVKEKKDDGFIVSIFDLDVTSVKPAVK